MAIEIAQSEMRKVKLPGRHMSSSDSWQLEKVGLLAGKTLTQIHIDGRRQREIPGVIPPFSLEIRMAEVITRELEMVAGKSRLPVLRRRYRRYQRETRNLLFMNNLDRVHS